MALWPIASRATRIPAFTEDCSFSEPTRVFLEVAASREDVVDLVALGDSLVRRKGTTPGELVVAPMATWVRVLDWAAERPRTCERESIRRGSRGCGCSLCWVDCPNPRSTTSFVN